MLVTIKLLTQWLWQQCREFRIQVGRWFWWWSWGCNAHSDTTAMVAACKLYAFTVPTVWWCCDLHINKALYFFMRVKKQKKVYMYVGVLSEWKQHCAYIWKYTQDMCLIFVSVVRCSVLKTCHDRAVLRKVHEGKVQPPKQSPWKPKSAFSVTLLGITTYTEQFYSRLSSLLYFVHSEWFAI